MAYRECEGRGAKFATLVFVYDVNTEQLIDFDRESIAGTDMLP